MQLMKEKQWERHTPSPLPLPQGQYALKWETRQRQSPPISNQNTNPQNAKAPTLPPAHHTSTITTTKRHSFTCSCYTVPMFFSKLGYYR